MVYGLSDLPHKWNDGTLECWKIGFSRDIIHFNFIVDPVGKGTINPALPIKPTFTYPLQAADQNPLFHYSSIPVFQHSNCEGSELSS
ncbi:hypothetical protein D1AOALGA4SA_12853 [Olavius algarvensis Delta 1 endosymbiont]|nr:hypothetical protein D1AOALGA4SA_12853 [Olavius algarvensis Delta 1 endosymbiont]